MSLLAEERKRYAAALERAVEGITRHLRQKPEVRRVVLFGSYAAGRRDLRTDLDLLVVMESSEDFVTRTARLHTELHSGVDMDLLVYTPEEFERVKERGFVRRALQTGVVLYEK